MEAWMITVLVIGFIIMIFFWGISIYGNHLKKKQQGGGREHQRDDDFQYRYMHRDEFDEGATYDSNGRPIK